MLSLNFMVSMVTYEVYIPLQNIVNETDTRNVSLFKFFVKSFIFVLFFIWFACDATKTYKHMSKRVLTISRGSLYFLK